MYLVYKSDNNHSYSSLDLQAVCTTEKNAFDMVKHIIKKEGFKLTKDDKHCLKEYQQTQGYKGEGEFLIQETPVNTLL